MKKVFVAVLGMGMICLAAAGFTRISTAQEPSPPEAVSTEAAEELKLETLLSAALEGVEAAEVIVSRVTMPPNTTLPKHWHPGEEFGYVLEGSVVLWQEGKEDIPTKKGDVIQVPLKQVHTAMTKDEGATILVFRVHKAGEPERVLVD